MDDLTEGYKCTFIPKPQEHFYCKDCKYVAREPTITTCCGRTFCQGCIEKVMQKGDPCTHCGKEVREPIPQLWYREEISTMRVECLKKDSGCDWEGTLKDLDTHLDQDRGCCKYIEIPCPRGCGVNIERKYIDAHLNNVCVERDFACQYCNKAGTYRTISTEHWSECADKPVQCPNMCGVTCEQNLMDDHKKMCPLLTIKCPYQSVGCMDEFQRRDEDDHMATNTQHHLKLTMETCQELKQELETTKNMYEEHLQEQAQGYAERLQAIEKQQAKAFKLHEENLNTMYQDYEHKLRTMKHNFEMVLHGKDESLKLVKEMMDGVIDSRVKQQVEEKIETFRQESGILPYNLKMTGFESRKHKNEIWYSPKMLTHDRGYTFLISVRPNGFDKSKGKSVGVWLRSAKGRYDGELKWPAKVTITLQLLNQHCDRDHLTVTKTFTLVKSSDEHLYISEFSPDFLPHGRLGYNALQQTQFLKGDCLKFRVTSITM